MKEEIKKCADSIFGTDTIVEPSLERTFYIYTAAWCISWAEVSKLSSMYEILAISVDGGHLNIEIKAPTAHK